ncbi:WRC domain [Sesbania bispinosa]|nr:WRC domain [Sesbania bispinosa]
MDQARSTNGEENVGIPDDLRCKRSDGKQWRCTAMSMPDKTVCEKHYIQAKKRAANSAMRANLKKAKRKSLSLGESDIYLESKSDDFDTPLSAAINNNHSSSSGKKFLDKVSKNQFRYTPESETRRGSSTRHAPRPNDDSPERVDVDVPPYEENWVSYDSPPASGVDSARKRSHRSLDANATTVSFMCLLVMMDWKVFVYAELKGCNSMTGIFRWNLGFFSRHWWPDLPSVPEE